MSHALQDVRQALVGNEKEAAQATRLASSRSAFPRPPIARILPRLPSLADIGRKLPPLFVSAHFVAALEIARHMQWLTPPAELDGRSFAISIEDLGLRLCFSCREQGFRLFKPSSGSQAERIDLELSAKLVDFANMARGAMDADTLFFQRRLKIAGDTDLGLIVKNWLDATERPAWLISLSQALDKY